MYDFDIICTVDELRQTGLDVSDLVMGAVTLSREIDLNYLVQSLPSMLDLEPVRATLDGVAGVSVAGAVVRHRGGGC